MRLLVCAPLLVAACSADVDDQATELPGDAIRIIGKLENEVLDEVSGIASSRQDPNLLWVINDDGPAAVYAIDLAGKHRARIEIAGARNSDWEDLASFNHNGEPHLVIADIGDNEARRRQATLYIIKEPSPVTAMVDLEWRIDFTYPDGPRDAESVAVDVAGGSFYVLSKRDVPARLYRVPLEFASEQIVTARRVVDLGSLPQPDERQRKDGRGSGYAWQPTAMDFSTDGSGALVLTYSAVYFYSRDTTQSWQTALASVPLQLNLGGIRNAESITFARDGAVAFATIEQRHAPLLQVDLSAAFRLPPVPGIASR